MNTRFSSFVFLPFIALSACASKQDIVLFNDDLRKLKSDSEIIKEKASGYSGEIRQVRDELQKLRSDTEVAKVQVSSANAASQQLRDELQKLKGNVEAMKVQSASFTAANQLLRDDVQKLKGETEGIKLQAVTSSSDIIKHSEALTAQSLAFSAEIQRLRDELLTLKTDSETLKKQSAASYADTQQLRDDVFRLQGSVDGGAHKSSETLKRLGVEDSLLVYKVDDLESRLQKAERAISGLGKQVALPPAILPQKPDSVETVKPPPVLPNDTALLTEGLEKFGKQDYPAARESFGSLLKNWPKSDLVDKAQFQLAECFFDEKKYENAILEYQVVIAKFSKSSKRPAALYKQGLAFERTGDAANAKARYKELIKSYPKSAEAALAGKKPQ